jgi:hypothetical protein
MGIRYRKASIICRYLAKMFLYRHREAERPIHENIQAAEEKIRETCSSSLKADPQTDRVPRHVLPEAIPGNQADARDP